MIQIKVTLRSRTTDVPFVTNGLAPTANCPLAITPTAVFDNATKAWRLTGKGFRITHLPSGFCLGDMAAGYSTQDKAARVLTACQPEHPAWLLATGKPDCAATAACKTLFRLASSEAK